MDLVEYELVNPSDCYTFLAPSLLIAAGAVCLLGEGRYGAHPVESELRENSVPIFLFGGSAEWFAEHGVANYTEYIKAHRTEIADCLDSFVVGDHGDRKRMERVLGVISSAAEREKALEAWHDERRSSMNNIGLRAKHLAKLLRASAAEAADHRAEAKP